MNNGDNPNPRALLSPEAVPVLLRREDQNDDDDSDSEDRTLSTVDLDAIKDPFPEALRWRSNSNSALLPRIKSKTNFESPQKKDFNGIENNVSMDTSQESNNSSSSDSDSGSDSGSSTNSSGSSDDGSSSDSDDSDSDSSNKSSSTNHSIVVPSPSKQINNSNILKKNTHSRSNSSTASSKNSRRIKQFSVSQNYEPGSLKLKIGVLNYRQSQSQPIQDGSTAEENLKNSTIQQQQTPPPPPPVSEGLRRSTRSSNKTEQSQKTIATNGLNNNNSTSVNAISSTNTKTTSTSAAAAQLIPSKFRNETSQIILNNNNNNSDSVSNSQHEQQMPIMTNLNLLESTKQKSSNIDLPFTNRSKQDTVILSVPVFRQNSPHSSVTQQQQQSHSSLPPTTISTEKLLNDTTTHSSSSLYNFSKNSSLQNNANFSKSSYETDPVVLQAKMNSDLTIFPIDPPKDSSINWQSNNYGHHHHHHNTNTTSSSTTKNNSPHQPSSIRPSRRNSSKRFSTEKSDYESWDSSDNFMVQNAIDIIDLTVENDQTGNNSSKNYLERLKSSEVSITSVDSSGQNHGPTTPFNSSAYKSNLTIQGITTTTTTTTEANSTTTRDTRKSCKSPSNLSDGDFSRKAGSSVIVSNDKKRSPPEEKNEIATKNGKIALPKSLSVEIVSAAAAKNSSRGSKQQNRQIPPSPLTTSSSKEYSKREDQLQQQQQQQQLLAHSPTIAAKKKEKNSSPKSPVPPPPEDKSFSLRRRTKRNSTTTETQVLIQTPTTVEKNKTSNNRKNSSSSSSVNKGKHSASIEPQQLKTLAVEQLQQQHQQVPPNENPISQVLTQNNQVVPTIRTKAAKKYIPETLLPEGLSITCNLNENKAFGENYLKKKQEDNRASKKISHKVHKKRSKYSKSGKLHSSDHNKKKKGSNLNDSEKSKKKQNSLDAQLQNDLCTTLKKCSLGGLTSSTSTSRKNRRNQTKSSNNNTNNNNNNNEKFIFNIRSFTNFNTDLIPNNQIPLPKDFVEILKNNSSNLIKNQQPSISNNKALSSTAGVSGTVTNNGSSSGRKRKLTDSERKSDVGSSSECSEEFQKLPLKKRKNHNNATEGKALFEFSKNKILVPFKFGSSKAGIRPASNIYYGPSSHQHHNNNKIFNQKSKKSVGGTSFADLILSFKKSSSTKRNNFNNLSLEQQLKNDLLAKKKRDISLLVDPKSKLVFSPPKSKQQQQSKSQPQPVVVVAQQQKISKEKRRTSGRIKIEEENKKLVLPTTRPTTPVIITTQKSKTTRRQSQSSPTSTSATSSALLSPSLALSASSSKSREKRRVTSKNVSAANNNVANNLNPLPPNKKEEKEIEKPATKGKRGRKKKIISPQKIKIMGNEMNVDLKFEDEEQNNNNKDQTKQSSNLRLEKIEKLKIKNIRSKIALSSEVSAEDISENQTTTALQKLTTGTVLNSIPQQSPAAADNMTLLSNNINEAKRKPQSPLFNVVNKKRRKINKTGFPATKKKKRSTIPSISNNNNNNNKSSLLPATPAGIDNEEEILQPTSVESADSRSVSDIQYTESESNSTISTIMNGLEFTSSLTERVKMRKRNSFDGEFDPTLEPGVSSALLNVSDPPNLVPVKVNYLKAGLLSSCCKKDTPPPPPPPPPPPVNEEDEKQQNVTESPKKQEKTDNEVEVVAAVDDIKTPKKSNVSSKGVFILPPAYIPDTVYARVKDFTLPFDAWCFGVIRAQHIAKECRLKKAKAQAEENKRLKKIKAAEIKENSRPKRVPMPLEIPPSWHFKRIRTNTYHSSLPKIPKEEPENECTCPDSENKCSTQDCINRVVFTECPISCGPNCQNQRIKKHANAQNLKRELTEHKGYGVFTTEEIKTGQFILEYVGEVVSDAVFKERMHTIYKSDIHHYCLHMDGGFVIDGHRSGGECRFVNHSCDPNCEMQKWRVNGLSRMALFALRDIQPGEELSYDYNFSLFNPLEGQRCYCGNDNCRGILGVRNAKNGKEKEDLSVNKRKPLRIFRNKTLGDRNDNNIPYEKLKISKKEKNFARLNSLFLIRNYEKALRKNCDLDHKMGDRVEKILCNWGSRYKPTSNKNKSPVIPKDDPKLARLTKISQILYELFAKLTVAKDNKGISLATPFMTIPLKKKYHPYYVALEKMESFDLNTIGKKIIRGYYKTIGDLESDIFKVLNSYCTAFNSTKPELINIVDQIRNYYFNLKHKAVSDLEPYMKKGPQMEFQRKKISAEQDIIRCICGTFYEEGAMVQCEKCLVWQHCECVGVPVNEKTKSNDRKKMNRKRNGGSTPLGLIPRRAQLSPFNSPFKPKSLFPIGPLQAPKEEGEITIEDLVVNIKEEIPLLSIDQVPKEEEEPSSSTSVAIKNEVGPSTSVDSITPNSEMETQKIEIDEVVTMPEPVVKLLDDTNSVQMEILKEEEESTDEPYFCEKCLNRKPDPEIKVTSSPSKIDSDKIPYLTLLREDGFLVRKYDTVYVLRDLPQEKKALNIPRPNYLTAGPLVPSECDILRIENLWKDKDGKRYGLGSQYIRPFETYHEPNRKFYLNEILRTPVFENINFDLIHGRCWVLDPSSYCKGRPVGCDDEAHVYICEYRVDKKARYFDKIGSKERQLRISLKPYAFNYFESQLKIARDHYPHGHPSLDPTSKAKASTSSQNNNEAVQIKVSKKTDMMKLSNKIVKKEKKEHLHRVLAKIIKKLDDYDENDKIDLSYLLAPVNKKNSRWIYTTS